MSTCRHFCISWRSGVPLFHEVRSTYDAAPREIVVTCDGLRDVRGR